LSALLSAAGAFLFPLRGAVASASTASRVVVVEGRPDSAVREAVSALGGMGRFVRKGHRVVLKPNVSFPNPPQWGSTTHPLAVRAAAELCLEAGAREVLVVDHPLRDPTLCFERSGLARALKGLTRVHLWAPVRSSHYLEVQVPSGRSLRTTQLAKVVLRADCIINLPTAKSHSATGVSLGLKNLMGLVWDRAVFHRDLDLHQAIADLATVLRPRLTILDATYALVTAGPGGPGRVEHWGRVVAGEDPVAVDAVAVGLGPWYGRMIRPGQVRHLRAAADAGLGHLQQQRITVVERRV